MDLSQHAPTPPPVPAPPPSSAWAAWSTPPQRTNPVDAVAAELAAMRDRIAAAHRAAEPEPETQTVQAEVLIQYQSPVTREWWDTSIVLPVQLPVGASVTASEGALTTLADRLAEPLRAAGAPANLVAVVVRPGRSALVGHAQVTA